MSFRARMLWTMLGLVIITTAATLTIAQRQSSAAYRAVVDELLGSQARAFQREQASRDALAAEQVARLAASVRLFAALEAKDPQVYKIAADELRLGAFDFFRLLTVAGDVMPVPADSAAAPGAGAADLPVPTASLAPDRAAGLVGDQTVQLGFAIGTGSPAPVYRLLAAPISNFGQHMGTLVLGQRVTGLDSGPGAESGAAAPGAALWIDGGRRGSRLAGGQLPEAVRDELSRHLASDLSPASAQIRAGDTAYRYQHTLLNEGSGYPAARLVSVFAMDAFEAEQRTLAWRILAIGLLAALAAGVAAGAVSRRLARPVADLVGATRQIRAGNYDQRLGPSGTREMDTLAESFNAMAADLALKDRYHSVLQQVADPQIAEELISGRVKLGGELREVTVMFCDIRGYTAITVGRAPEAVIDLLNHHMSAMSRVVQAHGGVINQFAGDAIMALFGAPRSYGDDAERAVRCAGAMTRERERLNAEVAVPISIGIGIASGRMVAGCIGAENRSDYTVVGERVNLAARLSSVAAAGEILIDEATRARISGPVACEPLPPLKLKGFSEPVPAYRVRADAEAVA